MEAYNVLARPEMSSEFCCIVTVGKLDSTFLCYFTNVSKVYTVVSVTPRCVWTVSLCLLFIQLINTERSYVYASLDSVRWCV